MEKQEKVEEFLVPQEVIFETLLELPVKSLLRLRCVSKLWCSTIDDPFFVYWHHIYSHTRPGGINILFGGEEQLYSASPEGDLAHRILNVPGQLYDERNPQHANGLIRIDDQIWNPSTRECIHIPPMTITPTSFKLQSSKLQSFKLQANSTSLSFYRDYFLGFDPADMKYKVLGRVGGARTEYKILTLGTNSWRDLDYSGPSNGWRHSNACCIAGIVYFINRLGKKNVLVAFEVGPEKFSVMSLPQVSDYSSYLLQVGEHVGVIDEKFTTIWILEDYKKQLWNKESVMREPLMHKVIPIGTIHTDEILLQLRDYYYDPDYYYDGDYKRKLFYYDPQRKKLRMVDLGKENNPCRCTKHVESIFRLKQFENAPEYFYKVSP